MKKSLIALAALAAVTAASAQTTATITGKLRFANGTQTNVSGTKASGTGVTDGDINFVAVEDLGGGLKATASMALLLRGRDTTVSGRDSSLTLSGPFGAVQVGAVEAGNGLLPLVTAGGPTFIGLDAGAQSATGMGTAVVGVLGAASNVDVVKYSTPSISGFTFSAAMLDATKQGGSEATAATQDMTQVAATYANGPLSAAIDVTQFGDNAVTGTRADSRTRMSANYDLGVARIGAGNESLKYSTGAKRTDTAIGVSAPFGAFLVGAVFANTKTDGTAGTGKGTDLSVQYNLSKRTYVAVQSRNTKQAGATASDKTTRVQLSHSF